MLQAIPEPRLRTYVVWVPLSFGREAAVPGATRIVPDLRARHYWDGLSVLVDGYRSPLSLDQPVWDVYLLYGPGVTWTDQPPRPEYWMQQLSERDETGAPVLDAVALRARVRALLQRGFSTSH